MRLAESVTSCALLVERLYASLFSETIISDLHFVPFPDPHDSCWLSSHFAKLSTIYLPQH